MATVTSENKAEHDREFMEKRGQIPKTRSQAKKGGEIAESNQYHYKGGQFLPTTEAEPGKWRVGKKWINAGRELVEPGKYDAQPTPFSRAIHGAIHGYTEKDKDGKIKMREGIKDYQGNPITKDTKIRLGVKGKMGKHEHSYGQLIDEYNKGNRWVHVEFDEPTLTTK